MNHFWKKLFGRSLQLNSKLNNGSRRTIRRLLSEQLEAREMFVGGTWTQLTNLAPSGIGTMMLLTDGTVMAQEANVSKNFYRLTPDATGNYHDGTWSPMPSMSKPRLYYGSNVLPSGNVFVLGGEYTNPNGGRTDDNTGEIFDPVANTWTPTASFPKREFGDDPTVLLPDGKIIAGYLLGIETYLFDPIANTWTQTADKIHNDASDEETWCILPDDSVITVDVFANNKAQRYVPSTGKWVDAGNVPVILTGNSVGFEMGPAGLLPDGRFFQVGGNNNTAIYTPSTNTWVAGPSLPTGLGADDSPGAMLPNGNFLFAVDTPLFNSPTKLYEFDPIANSLTDVTPSILTSALNQPAFVSRMLMLPNGNVLLTTSSNKLFEFTPNGSADPAWAPSVADISHAGRIYTITGTQLTGISEGATYGDDAEMSTNYPIAKLTDSTGKVTYARTFNWTPGVATGNKKVTAQFELPANIGPGPYKLNVIANGIASVTVDDIDSGLQITLDPTSSYAEDAVPSILTPNAALVGPNVTTLNNGVLTVNIKVNQDVGDLLGVSSQGFGASEIQVNGTTVFYSGSLIGTVATTPSSLSFTFNSAASLPAVEALIRRVTFSTTSQAPSTKIRSVEFFLNNGTNGSSGHVTTLVTVTPVNDAPFAVGAIVPSVPEDTVSPPGISIANLFTGVVIDPDANATIGGAVLVSNTTPSTEGKWQYSATATGIWENVGQVSDQQGLAIAASGRIRFVPARDYFGSPKPLKYRALDETYVGNFSAQGSRTIIDVSTTSPTGAISSADATIGTTITPVNDPPVAVGSLQTPSVLQDQLLSFLISTSLFKDVDDTVLNLAVSQKSGAPMPAWLSFNPITGILSGTPKNEDVGEYTLLITASDPSNTSATLDMILTVVNVNDAPTNIAFDAKPVLENVPGVFVGSLFGIDPDTSDSIEWTVLNDPRFEVHGNLLFVAPGSKLDFEKGATVTITVRATDNGTPPLFVDQQETFSVIDVNEFAPALHPLSFDISEGTVPASVGKVFAADADTANTVQYRFIGTPPTNFKIDSATGQISLAPGKTLDFEQQSNYQFFVEAYDNGLPPLATSSSVNINVLDVNEFDPVLTKQTISLSENQSPNSPFFRVAATDQDTKQTFQFQLLPSENRFKIDSKTGDLTLLRTGTFDFETKSTDSVVILVSDSGSPSRSTQGTFAISITDANDPPTGASILNPNVLSNISETSLGKITIADQDIGQQYSIVSQDDRFIVKDGNLFLAPGKSLGDTLPTQLTVPITATELGANPLSYPLSIPITRIANANPWQNRLNPLDVDRTGDVGPLDVLSIINAVNAGKTQLTFPRPASTLTEPDYDADGDGSVSPLDVLAIINFINGRKPGAGEGESSQSDQPTQTKDSSGVWLAAFTQLEEERTTLRRKRS